MPQFVHVADERDTAANRRAGLKLPRAAAAANPRSPRGVFAMPVTPNFFVTHQWVRELKRRGHRVAAGVYFRLDDHEPVWAGRYNEDKRLLSADEATAELARGEQLGFEVIIPRAIRAAEIRDIRRVPQVVGWRFYPDAHSRVPCPCPSCRRGDIRSRSLRERYEREQSGGFWSLPYDASLDT